MNPSRLRTFALDAFQVAQVGSFSKPSVSFDGPKLHPIHFLLQEIAPKGNMIIHSFSNGGAFLVAEHLRSWSKGESTTLDPARVAGLVFDSAPAYLHAGAGGKAMTASMPPGPVRSTAAAAITVLSTVWGSLVGERGPDGYWKLMGGFQPLQRGDGTVCPELYVYSEDDTITHFSDLQGLVHGRAELPGSHVLEAVFRSSPHVSHLKTAPSTYAAICGAFAKYVQTASRDGVGHFDQAVQRAAGEDSLKAEGQRGGPGSLASSLAMRKGIAA